MTKTFVQRILNAFAGDDVRGVHIVRIVLTFIMITIAMREHPYTYGSSAPELRFEPLIQY